MSNSTVSSQFWHAKATDMQPIPLRSRRISKGKTRSGCLTCKIRHVKCDEEKPYCAKCRSTGRKCDGYIEQKTNNVAKQQKRQRDSAFPIVKSNPESRLVLYPGTSEERQHVQFFCTRSSRAMAGLFESEIWTYYLPQLCQTVPVVRHAAAAVAARHECLLHSHAAPKEAYDTFALQQYNKAIGHLMNHISTKDSKIDFTILTCFLFVALEMLCGNPKEALNHMQGGVQMLHQQGHLNGFASGFPENIEKELLHLGLRLNLQLSFYGRPLTQFEWNSVDRVSAVNPWPDISQARYSLDLLMNKGLKLHRDVGIERPLPSFDMIRQQNRIMNELQDWKIKFDRLMKSPRKRITSLDPRMPLQLYIQHRVSSVFVQTCLNKDEIGYDNHNDAFKEIVCNAEKWMHFDREFRQQAIKHGGYSDKFTFEAGIIPMAYWTATKCRSPVIRRRAIDVLRYFPAREGLWKADYLSVVGTMVADIEEMNVNNLPIEKRVPSDKDRAYDVLLRTGNEFALPRGSNAELRFKPDGCDGPWAFKLMYVSDIRDGYTS